MRNAIEMALNNRFMVIALGLLLLVWGAISFHNLPVEAYPDVANNYVQIITQWPGRAAEEVEQQVTIPIEVQMNGIPHLQHLRSASLFGLVERDADFRRRIGERLEPAKVLERLSQVTLPNGLQPQMGADWSPVGQIFWYTLNSTNPKYDLMDLKSIQDWTLEKQFKSVPNVVDVSSFGGMTREYQVRLDPDKLIAYGVTRRASGAATREQQRQRGRQFRRSGTAADQRARRRAVHECGRHRADGDQDAERYAGARTGISPRSRRRRRFGWGRSAKRFIAPTGRSWIATTWWKESCCCARARMPTRRW